MSMNNAVIQASAMATKGLAQTKFFIQRKGPDIIFWSGLATTVVGGVVGMAMVQKNTPELNRRGRALKRIIAANKKGKATKKDIIIAVSSYGKSAAKAYLPGFGLMLAGGFMMGGAFMTRTAQLGVTSASLAESTLAMALYRKRIKETFGDDADKIGLGVKKVEKEVEKINSETGEVTTEKIEVDDWSDTIKDLYTVVFDKKCRGYENDHYLTLRWLEAQESYYKARLHAQGYLWLSDVLTDLGIEPTNAQRNVGWLYDSNDHTGKYGDDFVDFGFKKDAINFRRFMDGYDIELIMNFNCVGDIRNGYERLRKGVVQ